MPFRERSFWLALGALTYVCLGSLPNAREPLVPMLGLVVLALWLGEIWRRTRRAEIGDRKLEPAARSAVRACHFGAVLWIAARFGAPGHAARDAVANLAAATAAVAALVSLARLASEGGLIAPPPSSRSLDAAAFAGLLWGIAVALPATRALFSTNDVLLDPLAIDYATTTAAIGSLLVLVAASLRLRVQRRLEIGVADRVGGALSLALTALIVALLAALADVASPDRVLPAAVVIASLACAWAATTREPTTVSSTLRGVLAILILGVPAALFIAIAARAYPEHAAPITLVGSIVTIAIGLVARDVARPLGPDQSRFLSAIERASHGALQPEPDAAIRAALAALRTAYRDPSAKPELWRNAPEEVLSVDVAGYLHVVKASAPELLLTLASAEPERTLRVETLRALEVRRPEVRPVLAWFEARDALCATTVVDEDGPLGFLLLPKSHRKRSITLEEARAIRLLGDRISALLAVSSALARSRERELRAAAHATEVDAECARLDHIIQLAAGRHRASAELVARATRVATYSPAARFARDELERHGHTGEPLALVVPPGVHAAGWAATAHLASPGSGGPFVVADAATSLEHDEERWRDPVASPLALADGGTLLILDVAALPLVIQDDIARAIVRRVAESAPSSIPPPMLVVSVREPVDDLVLAGRLSQKLAARVGRRVVTLPFLADRSEDLRALVLDRLAGIGMRTRGEPLGIEASALSLLLEHAFPGNDTELDDVLVRVARVATGPAVTRENLAAIGFHKIEATAPRETPSIAPEPRGRRSPAARSVS